ncbi:hypothetical protein SprV_0200942300 [Sparganum proliferum]
MIGASRTSSLTRTRKNESQRQDWLPNWPRLALRCFRASRLPSPCHAVSGHVVQTEETCGRDSTSRPPREAKIHQVVVSKSPVKTETHRFSSGCVDRLLPAIPQLPPKMCFPLNGTSPLPEVCIMPRASKRPAPGDLCPEFLDLMEPRNKLARLSCRYDQFNPIYDEVYSGSDGELLEEEEENVYDEIAPDSLFGAAFCRPRNRLVATRRLRNRLSPRTRAKTVFQPRHPPSCLDLMQVSRFSCSFSDSAEDSESENIYALHGDEFLTELCDNDSRPSSIYDEVASDYDDEVDSVSDLDEGLEFTTCFDAAQRPMTMPGGTAALGRCTFTDTVRPVVFPPSATANHCVKWMRRESFIV